MEKRYFFDNGSGSFPKAPGLAEALIAPLSLGSGNINRSTYVEATEIGMNIIEARENLCEFFNFSPATHIIFTAGVTASLNYIIKGFLKPGDHVIVSALEHNAVMRPLVQLEKEGITFDRIPPRPSSKDEGIGEGALCDCSAVEALIKKNTKLAIITHASNVSGFIQPIEELSEIFSKHHIPLVIDSAQTAGHLPIDCAKLRLAALCFTGHKGLLGPQGIGGILFSPSFAERVEPLITGGTGSASDSEVTPHFMPDRFEAGTQNITGIAGLHHSITWLKDYGIQKIHEHEQALTRLFLEGLINTPFTIVGGTSNTNRVGLISLDFTKKIDNGEAAFILENEYGILTRCGLHCAPNAHKVLNTFPHGTVRFSVGPFTTEEDVTVALRAIHALE